MRKFAYNINFVWNDRFSVNPVFMNPPRRWVQVTLIRPFSFKIHAFYSKCTPSNLSPYTTPLQSLLEPILNQNLPPLSSYASLFQFLTAKNFLKLGQQIHSHMLLHGRDPNAFVAAKMVAMYASSGDLHSAVLLFNAVSIINASPLLYNSMIRAYAKHGFASKTLDLFCQMHCRGFRGDYFTFPFVLKSCADASIISMGKSLHVQVSRIGIEFDIYVAASLIDMYVKCGEIRDARQVFGKMSVRDVSSWNALIAGYMRQREISIAENLFAAAPCKNVVSWTAMISGYTQNGLAEQSLRLFDEMLEEDSEVKPNWVTIMSVLPACAHSADLERGRKIHSYASRIGLDTNSSVQTALVAMYANCGSLVDARLCFDKIYKEEKNLIAWNTMITAYASHGRGLECLLAFEEMIRAGLHPDKVTFVGLLSGCSHSGLLDAGLNYFNSMRTDYSVEPTVEHYACVVDLLGRAGRLAEAKELINRMPMQPGPSIWGALLAAGQKHKNLDIAEVAVRELSALEPDNGGNYVLLSNMYAEAEMWKDVDDLRGRWKVQRVKKIPGCSWIEVNGESHMFLGGGDLSHPKANEISML